MIEAGKRYRIKHTDPGRRFLKGEIGIAMPNDFDKYDGKLDLGNVKIGERTCNRIFYFYKEELELVE